MRTIEEQLHQIMKHGIATVQGPNDPIPEQFNVLPLAAFFPAIDPERLGHAWQGTSKTGGRISAYERMTRYLESTRGPHVALPHLAASAPEQATVIETVVSIDGNTGDACGALRPNQPISIRIRSEPSTEPSTISSVIQPGLPLPKIGNVIQLQRDRLAGNDRLAMVLQVDKASDDTVVSTVRWYKSTPTPWEALVGTKPPWPNKK